MITAISTESLVGRPHQRLPWPAPLLDGDCRRFSHPDAQLQAHRTQLPLYGGDLSFQLWQLPRGAEAIEDAAASWFLQAILNQPHQTLTADALDAYAYMGESFPAPAATSLHGLLWELAGMGTVMWDWEEITLRHDPTFTSSHRFQRVFGSLQPQTTARDVAAIQADALAQLYRLTQPHGTISPKRFAAIIKDELKAVKNICRQHGTYGAAIIEDAPIEAWWIATNDGNVRRLVAQTPSRWIGFSYTTS